MCLPAAGGTLACVSDVLSVSFVACARPSAHALVDDIAARLR